MHATRKKWFNLHSGFRRIGIRNAETKTHRHRKTRRQMETDRFDKIDEQILRMLSENARIPFLEVARACGVSGTTIHQRVQRLTSLGVIDGAEYRIEPSKIGYETCAYIGLDLSDPTLFQSAVDALGRIPEVVEIHCTSEAYSLFVKVYARNNDHLLTIIRTKFHPLGLIQKKIIVSFKTMHKKPLMIFSKKSD